MAAKRKLVVIGGVAAGMSAAAKARRIDPDLEITVFEQGEWISYSACGLPYFVGDLVPEPARLVARTVADFAKQRIEVKLRHHVQAIDAERHTIQVVDRSSADAKPFEVAYDALVVATGARPVLPNVNGQDLAGVFNLYVMTDALAMRAYIAEHKPRRAVVVGGGYIGLEMAENLQRLGLEIAVVQRPPQLFSNIDADIAELVGTELERQQVDLSLCESVLEACVGSDGQVEHVHTSRGDLDADLVLFSIGIRPNVELALGCGVQLGDTGAIAVDEHQRTNRPSIYAAGDCAEHYHRIKARPAWIPLGTNANKQGRIAGENAAGGHARFKGIVGTAITRAFELEIGRTGLTEKEAQAEGLEYAAATVDYTDIAGYYPDAEPLRVKLLAERGTGRLLGAQAAGRGGVAKRIDVAATALHAGMTVDDLAWLDLGYAPPFNSVWDPLLVAAGILLKDV